jgi:hypothetical protein
MSFTLSKLLSLALLASAATGGSFAQDAPAPKPAEATPGTRRVSVNDPELDMEAFSIHLPATWIFDGMLVPRPPCSASDSMAIRMESPDGLTVARVLPAINWTYYDAGRPNDGGSQCSMYGGMKSASDILKSAIHLFNVEYVSDAPTDIDQIRQKFAANKSGSMHWVADKARAKVKFKVNSIEMDGRVSALVLCSQNTGATYTACSATISRSWAPVGQYDDAFFETIQKTLTLNAEWFAKRQAQMEKDLRNSQTQKVITDPVQRMHDPKRTAALEARKIFERQRDDLFPNAAPYPDAGDPGTHPFSMIRKPPVPDRVVDDWADYAIEIAPTLWSAGAAANREYVWINAGGERLKTPSINDNPNGKGTGDWKLQPDATAQSSKP